MERTGKTGDQGVDLIVTWGARRIAVQAKGYPGTTVGNKAVQEVHAGKDFYHCNAGIVVTNSTFTPHAEQLAASVGCTLIDGSKIPDLIRGNLL